MIWTGLCCHCILSHSSTYSIAIAPAWSLSRPLLVGVLPFTIFGGRHPPCTTCNSVQASSSVFAIFSLGCRSHPFNPPPYYRPLPFPANPLRATFFPSAHHTPSFPIHTRFASQPPTADILADICHRLPTLTATPTQLLIVFLQPSTCVIHPMPHLVSIPTLRYQSLVRLLSKSIHRSNISPLWRQRAAPHPRQLSTWKAETLLRAEKRAYQTAARTPCKSLREDAAP